MVMRTTGAGSKYPFTARAADGAFLNGSNSYRLHLPPNRPAALFWAVTAYNVPTAPCPRAAAPALDQRFQRGRTNQDGSIDLWFGPKNRAPFPKFNWIQTVAGRNFSSL